MTERNRRLLRSVLFSAVGALVLVAGAGVVSAFSTGEPPSIGCDATAFVYGESISCSADGSDVVAIEWPDAEVTAVVSARAPRSVGEVEVSAVDGDGEALASVIVLISPDIALRCDQGDEKIIYELEATELRSQGWDYVFIESGTGERVRPGDLLHPNGGVEVGLERIEVGRAASTGFCRIHSHAAEEFGGEYEVTLVSPWEGTVSHPVAIIGPASRTRWAGTQPAELTGTVTVANVTASERMGVYMSGCS
ncbi:MAG: hypothetical protein ACR2P0_02195 [Acidimicrobiales bacterium]